MDKPPKKCPGEDGELFLKALSFSSLKIWSHVFRFMCATCSPGHTVTVILSPLVRCIAAAVRSGHLEEPKETAARGTDRPVVHLQTQSLTAGAALHSCMLSVTPEHPSERADAEPDPSTQLSPPPCS